MTNDHIDEARNDKLFPWYMSTFPISFLKCRDKDRNKNDRISNFITFLFLNRSLGQNIERSILCYVIELHRPYPTFLLISSTLKISTKRLNPLPFDIKSNFYHFRHLVKNSFIVELAEGQRKLRHLFLFNDVLVCAKYKASGGGHHPTPGVAVGRNQEKFTFQLKWYIPLEHVRSHFQVSLFCGFRYFTVPESLRFFSFSFGF